ncbi:MAG: hypothetical protein A3F17_09300 [Gammaproteobacteria bacterium RIFCSPHIGHO2_12_FULL_41_15]|nr:MAG: hypothetical protein A3F17_09300 [Gammaproteobacteria bacterium RIFCSPHIGHO2_12_FULL_41_15]
MDNPYLQSKVLWNDLYGSVEEKLRFSYRIIIALSVTLLACTMGLIVVATQSRVQPYVTVVHGNELLTLHNFNQPGLNEFKPKLALLLAREFIQKARNISADPKVNQQNFIAALSMTSNGATHVLKDYHQSMTTHLKQITITSLILQSKKALHLRWQEITRDAKTGDVLSTENYSAELTFEFTKASTNPLIAEQNPLGFYITSLAWSQDYAV